MVFVCVGGPTALAAPKLKISDKESPLCSQLQKDITKGLKEVAEYSAINKATAIPQRTGKILHELELNNSWNLVNISVILQLSQNCKIPSITPAEQLEVYIRKAQECVRMSNDVAVFSKPAGTAECKKEQW